jgi:uncharacterized protein YeaO (DUF488 family)
VSIHLKRAFESPSKEDGYRVLVDRVWPRGIKKEDLSVEIWLKEVGPSTELRKWFGHDPERWEEFRKRYFRELERHREEISALAEKARKGRVTLVFGSREQKYNNAAALKEYIEKYG